MTTYSQNNSKDNKDRGVNTRGITLYNKNGFDPSALSIGYWNDAFLSLRINPALEQSKQTQTRVFDYDKSVNATLTPQIMQLMSYTVKSRILPAIEAGEERSVGIQVGGDSLVVIGTGKKITGEIRPYLAIHKALNPETKKPELSIFYEFNKGQVIEDFDEENGSYNLVTGINNELMLFIEILDASVAALSKADVHAMRSVMRFYNDKLMNTTIAIASKVGAPVPQSSSSRYSNGGNYVDFTSTSGGSSSDDGADYTTINDLSEMLG